MKINYKIFPCHESIDTLSIHTSIKNTFKYISFGMKSIAITICTKDHIDTNAIYMSENIIELLGIPVFCNYEIIIKDDTLILGPYIGILTPKINKGLHRYFNDLNSYVKKYHEIGGTIVAFTLEDIDPLSQTILKGHIFNPLKKDWESRSDISYPSVIFNRCKVTHHQKWEFLQSLYREKIFNFPTFNKWEMYSWFQDDTQLKKILPKTVLCHKPSDILQFMQKFPKAFLKPIGGTIAKGIIEITMEENVIRLRYQKRKQTINRTFENKRHFKQFIKRWLRRGIFLIQEAIDLLSINDQMIDFRLIYLKNSSGTWEDVELFARYGKPGSAVSNVSSGGKSKIGMLTLKEWFAEEKANEVYEKMVFYCRIASSVLEKHLIQCGNLGFDFAIDTQHKLWIIEINNEDPDHRIALVSKRKNLLYFARKQNLLFAKYLAGFTNP